VPSGYILRRIATGAHALRRPTDSRRFYLVSELARELASDQSTVHRWLHRGYLRSDTSAGFITVPVDEALRFSREGPPRSPLAAHLEDGTVIPTALGMESSP
jgi:hypothetical protein